MRPERRHRSVAPAMAAAWRRSRPAHSSCVRRVERVTDGVRRFPSLVTNARARAKLRRRNSPPFQFQQVNLFLEPSHWKTIFTRSGRWANDASEFGLVRGVRHLSSQTERKVSTRSRRYSQRSEFIHRPSSARRRDQSTGHSRRPSAPSRRKALRSSISIPIRSI